MHDTCAPDSSPAETQDTKERSVKVIAWKYASKNQSNVTAHNKRYIKRQSISSIKRDALPLLCNSLSDTHASGAAFCIRQLNVQRLVYLI